MEHETGVQTPPLHTLIPLAEFNVILNLDDREDTLSRYCLITATYSIEQYCKRRSRAYKRKCRRPGGPLLPYGYDAKGIVTQKGQSGFGPAFAGNGNPAA